MRDETDQYLALVVAIVVCSVVVHWLTGCYVATDLQDETTLEQTDRLAVDAAVDAWRDNLLPLSDTCRAQRRTLTVLALPRMELQRCGSEEPLGPVLGCYIPANHSIWVPDDVDTQLRQDIVVHEAVHWLHHCNWDTTDPQHTGIFPLLKTLNQGVCVWDTDDLQCIVPAAWSRL